MTIKDELSTDSGIRYSGKQTKSLSLQNLISRGQSTDIV